ncbi:DUF1173 domain-containing protein [Sinorhizobium fredii]|uniref:DUF1173 domain-containing protein n=1 Tax=Rhizobium fredii TaxID=380 RepID=UPI0004AE824B|nr:DUF1173 domain-containing protein [Sinorhizobium fredii]
MTSKYQIRNAVIAADAADFQTQLEQAHNDKSRPLCLCQRPPVEMYIARFGDRRLVKRMPGTGAQHDVGCEHFEAPPSLSGLGDVMGRAIQDRDDGSTVLKLDFSLSKTGNRVAPQRSENGADTVKADAGKLTLLGLFHYLWHEAELHRWMPAFRGKRGWRLVRDRLSEAASQKVAKQIPLMERLYIPEPFSPDHADAIEARRRAFTGRFRSDNSKKRDLLLIVGEIKEIGPARFGSKITIKHAPKFPVFIDDKAVTQLQKRFAVEFALSQAYEHLHLMMIATASVNQADAAIVEEVSLMLVNENWIPIETVDELSLIEALTTDNRAFLKGLRFNVRDRPLASVLLTDLRPPVGLYIVSAEADPNNMEIIDELAQQTQIPAWIWNLEDGAWPEIPRPN